MDDKKKKIILSEDSASSVRLQIAQQTKEQHIQQLKQNQNKQK